MTAELKPITDGAGTNTGVYPPEKIAPNALILTQTTGIGAPWSDSSTLTIPFVASDPPAEVTAEGGEIAVGNPTVNSVVIRTQKVTSLAVFSNEFQRDGDASDMILKSQERAITRTADRMFLQNPAPSEGAYGVTGLINQKGIVDGGTFTGDLAPLVKLIGTLGANNANPTAIIMGYDVWSVILTLTFGDGRPIVDPVNVNTDRPTLYGIPVVLNNECPAGTLFVIDSSEILAAYTSVQFTYTFDRYFEQDAQGSRFTFRFGYTLPHPNRIGYLKYAAPTGK
ncbi:phage major capsid protein [Pseudoscardovia radai]|uniref:phage major capsid protein n=1 Tax=Pseudoscardovia radai TaxID=987066 RepID=UPI00399455F2